MKEEKHSVLERCLIPNIFKYIGAIILISGIIASILRFKYGLKPDYLKVKVFAIYSTFLETKLFSVITNNFSEEVVGLLILFGLILICFSKEKNETESINKIRKLSLQNSVIAYVVSLLISFLTVFGIAFLNVLVIIIYLPFIAYLISFYVLKLKMV